MAYILRINDGTQFSILSHIENGTTTISGIKTSTISFAVLDTPLQDLQKIFTDSNRTLVIKEIAPSGLPLVTKAGYTMLLGIVSDGIIDNAYKITLGIPTNIEEIRRELTNIIASFQIENNRLHEELEACYKQISSLSDEPDINNMTLDSAKAYMIEKSNSLLSDFLVAHPIESNVHKGIFEKYSVTQQKQFELSAAIARANIAIESGVNPVISWNTYGEDCTDDWSLDELCRLSLEIYDYVKPYVSLQRYYEKKIKECVNIKELNKINIVYSQEYLYLIEK